MSKFLDNWEPARHCCENILGIDFISLSDKNIISGLVLILAEYKMKIKIFESNKDINISKVLTGLYEIKLLLEEQSPINNLEKFSKVLIKDFDKRFACVFDSSSRDFCKYFSLATYLDPTTHKYINIKAFKELKEYCEVFFNAYLPVHVTNNQSNNQKSKLDSLLDENFDYEIKR